MLSLRCAGRIGAARCPAANHPSRTMSPPSAKTRAQAVTSPVGAAAEHPEGWDFPGSRHVRWSVRSNRMKWTNCEFPCCLMTAAPCAFVRVLRGSGIGCNVRLRPVYGARLQLGTHFLRRGRRAQSSKMASTISRATFRTTRHRVGRSGAYSTTTSSSGMRPRLARGHPITEARMRSPAARNSTRTM